jgi:hypothetical protein
MAYIAHPAWQGLPQQDVCDALAAAGVIEASPSSNVGSLVDTLTEKGALGVREDVLREWRPPGTDLLDSVHPGDLAASWRRAVGRVSSEYGKPPVMRLWCHTVEASEALTRLTRATPPDQGMVAVSLAKVLTRSRPVPRWTWPLIVGVPVSAPRMAELLVHQPAWLRDLVTFVDLDDPLQRCSLALLPDAWEGTLLDPYGRPRAAAAVVLGPAPQSPLDPVLQDEERLGTTAAAVFTGSSDDPGQLVEIVRHLSHDLPLDAAAAMTAATRQAEDHRVYGEQQFLERTWVRRMAVVRAAERAPRETGYIDGGLVRSADQFAEDFRSRPFALESRDSTVLAHDLREMERRTGRSEKRYLQAAAEERQRARQPGPVASLQLSIWIGPSRRQRKGGMVEIDESSFEWDGDRIDLTVALIPLQGQARPRQLPLVLPRTGASEPVRFTIRVSDKRPYRARIAVLRERRFVQTALVTVTHSGKVTLRRETVVRPLTSDLLEVLPAEVAIVHNHDHAGRPHMAALTEDEAWSVVPAGLSGVLRWFQEGLEAVADAPDDFGSPDSPEFARMVVELAESGAELNRRLFTGRASAILAPQTAELLELADSVSVLSVVAGDILPIEFVYDRELVTGPGRPGHLCPRAADAALAGHCCTEEAEDAPDAQTVCPFGFWGMRKVIERHVNRDDAAKVFAAGGAAALSTQPTVDTSVTTLRAVLAGASGRADLNPAEAWSAARTTLTDRLGANIRFATTWEDWQGLLDQESADVLLMLPHVGQKGPRSFLEIGNDDSLKLVNNLNGFVLGRQGMTAGRPPIVLLLGCATAAGAPLDEFPSKFLDAGARLVIGTLTAVRGRFVAPLGARLAVDILEQSTGHGVMAGELLRDLRLSAFATGDPTAMTLVSFGDSSWVLKRR